MGVARLYLLEVRMESTWSQMGLQISLLSAAAFVLWVVRVFKSDEEPVRIRVEPSQNRRAPKRRRRRG